MVDVVVCVGDDCDFVVEVFVGGVVVCVCECGWFVVGFDCVD